MKKVLVCVLLLAIHKAAFADEAGLPPGILTPSQEALTLVHEGDAQYALRDEQRGAPEALAAYEKAIGKDPNLVEAYWKASRAWYWIADHEKKIKKKIEGFEKGIKLAKKGIELDPNSVESHFWLGGNYGTYGETRGVLKSLFLVKPIRKEMEEVIRINDRYQGGGGYRVLGVVDYKVPPFAGGSKKRALLNLKKALEFDPKNAFNNYYMAEYFELVGERYKAFDYLKVLESATPTRDVDAPDLKFIQGRGLALKKKMGS